MRLACEWWTTTARSTVTGEGRDTPGCRHTAADAAGGGKHWRWVEAELGGPVGQWHHLGRQKAEQQQAQPRPDPPISPAPVPMRRRLRRPRPPRPAAGPGPQPTLPARLAHGAGQAGDRLAGLVVGSGLDDLAARRRSTKASWSPRRSLSAPWPVGSGSERPTRPGAARPGGQAAAALGLGAVPSRVATSPGRSLQGADLRLVPPAEGDRVQIQGADRATAQLHRNAQPGPNLQLNKRQSVLQVMVGAVKLGRQRRATASAGFPDSSDQGDASPAATPYVAEQDGSGP